jgi:hypothetical protein
MHDTQTVTRHFRDEYGVLVTEVETWTSDRGISETVILSDIREDASLTPRQRLLKHRDSLLRHRLAWFAWAARRELDWQKRRAIAEADEVAICDAMIDKFRRVAIEPVPPMSAMPLCPPSDERAVT